MKTTSTNNISYKDVCLEEESVWFETDYNNIVASASQFLTWAKSLGCTWRGGVEIDPQQEIHCCHFAIRADGCVGLISMLAWTHPSTQAFKRYSFERYLNGDKTPIGNGWKRIG